MFPKATQECRVHSSFYLRVSFFKIAQKVANNLGYVPLLEILSLRIFINRPIWSHWLREIEEGSCYSLNVFFGVLLTTLTMASPVASMASVVRIRRCFERPDPNKRHWITKGHFISPSPPLTFWHSVSRCFSLDYFILRIGVIGPRRGIGVANPDVQFVLLFLDWPNLN